MAINDDAAADDASDGAGTARDARGESFAAVASADVLHRTVAFADALVDECRIEIRPDGLRITAVDPTTVALVDVELGADAFESYAASEGRVGVNLARLGDVLGMAGRDDLVRLRTDDETRTLEIEFDGLEYALAMIDPDAIRSPPERSTMEIDFDAGATLDAATVHRAIAAASMVSDHVTLETDADDETFHVEAAGDTDDVSLTLDADELESFAPGEASSMFSLSYLESIDRAIPGESAVEVELGTEAPVAMATTYAGGAGSVEYLLSPRRRASY